VFRVTHVDPRYRCPVFGLTTLLAAHLVRTIGRLFAVRSEKPALPEPLAMAG
jgi:hypothetical protein